jgi:hypothetical protein
VGLAVAVRNHDRVDPLYEGLEALEVNSVLALLHYLLRKDMLSVLSFLVQSLAIPIERLST